MTVADRIRLAAGNFGRWRRRLTCWAIGHRHEGYSGGYYWDWSGRRRERRYSRCGRCHSQEWHINGWWTALAHPVRTWRSVWWWLRGRPRAIRTWWRGEACRYCGVRETRFGRPTNAEHGAGCIADDIPF